MSLPGLQALDVLPQRIRVSRESQELTKSDLSNRSKLSIGYICGLEKGGKVNPSITAILALACALNVSVSYLVGEVARPSPDSSPIALRIAKEFSTHLRSVQPQQRTVMQRMTVEQRFVYAVKYVCNTRSSLDIKHSVVAFQSGLSPWALRDILHHRHRVGLENVEWFSTFTGIPLDFFTKGALP